MQFECHTCGAGYRCPDDKVRSAGTTGLRVRCKKCRSIMVWALQEEQALSEAAKVQRLSKLRSDVALTDVHAAAEVDDPVPARIGRRGNVSARTGVFRQVAGVEFPKVRGAKRRTWFAGIGGKPCGPFAREEIVHLAREGKVRGSTLVWAPGFEAWIRVRSAEKNSSALDWLRDEVVARKRWEQDAARRAREAMGIVAFEINDDGRPPPPLPAQTALQLDSVEGVKLTAKQSRLSQVRPWIWALSAAILVFGAVALASRYIPF